MVSNPVQIWNQVENINQYCKCPKYNKTTITSLGKYIANFPNMVSIKFETVVKTTKGLLEIVN